MKASHLSMIAIFLDGCVDCNSATSHMNCLYLYSFSRKIIQDGIFVRFFLRVSILLLNVRAADL